jgi:hypothetical protein
MDAMTIRREEVAEGMLFAGEGAVTRIHGGWPNGGAGMFVEMEGVVGLIGRAAAGRVLRERALGWQTW